MARFTLSALGGLVLAVSLGAQSTRPAPSPQQPVFRSGVELVQVDVVVVDKDGNAVRGLTQADFAIADRKKPQTIATFSEESHEHALEAASAVPAFPPTLKLDVSSNQAVQADRLVVMVVDDLHIFQGRTDRSKELTRQIITELGAQASMALLFTSGEHSTQVTNDRSELLAAAETLKGRQGWRRPHEAVDNQMPGIIDPEAPIETILAQLAGAQKHTLQDFFDNMTQYKTLQDAARMLGSDDTRRKAFVLLSEGIAKDLTGMFDAPLTPCESDPLNTLKPCYHDHAIRDMMDSMRRSHVTTYAIDPRGKVRSEDLLREGSGPAGGGMLATPAGKATDEDSQFRWSNPVRQAQDGLSILAKASGGFAVTDTDDFTSGLSRIIEDIDHYYLLGFYPTNPLGKGYRPLDVTVPGHPEWTLRFRQGYEPGGPPPPPKNADPLAALLAGVMPKTDLPLRLFATAFPGAGKIAHVEGAIEITASTRDLIEADTKLHDEVSYEVVVVDDKKSKVTSRTAQGARFVLTPASAAGPMPESVAYQIPLSLELAPGQYQFRASATSVKLDRGGSVYLTVDVPDFTKDSIALSGVVLGYAGGSHVPVGRVASTPVAPATGRATAQPVPVANALPFDPTLDRDFARTDVLRLYFAVAKQNAAVAVRASVELVDAHDQIPLALSELPTNDRGQVNLTIKLNELEPGPYRLRVTASEGTHAVSKDVGLIVR